MNIDPVEYVERVLAASQPVPEDIVDIVPAESLCPCPGCAFGDPDCPCEGCAAERGAGIA